MSWTPEAGQLPGLRSSLAEAEGVVGAAFGQAVGRYGFACPAPEIDPFDPVKREWRVGWWLRLPRRVSPREWLKCELTISDWSPSPEVSGWVEVERYAGHGVTVDDDLWRSADHPVETPAEAASAVRHVATELVRKIGELDLGAYLGGGPDA